MFCVLELGLTGFVMTLEQSFHNKYGNNLPYRNVMSLWVQQFETHGLCPSKSVSHLQIPQETEVKKSTFAVQKSYQHWLA